MSEAKTYQGSCHCGAVKYEVTTSLEQTITCNCSICKRSGHFLTFVPAGSFTLKQGEENLTDYQFNKMVIHHLFCKTCGVRSFARGKGPDGSDSVAVNVRCLDGVDLEQLKPFHYDGASK